MLSTIEKGRADAIICWHINRLVRNRKEAGHLEQLVIDGKIRCIKTPEREYWSDDNALFLALETAQAAQYSRDLSHDVTRGSREKAERGWWPFRSKLGYRVDPDTGNVEINPPVYSLLRRAWGLILSENYTVPQVLDEITRMGLRVRANREHQEDRTPRPLRPISRSSLYRMFRDPFYTGHFLFNGTLKRGNHKAMVTAAEYAKVQTFLSRGEHVQPKRHEFAYTGLIRCGACGGLITAEHKVKHYLTTGKTSSYTYYHCIGRSGCRKTSVAVDFLDSEILDLLERCRVDRGMTEWANRELEADRAGSVTSIDDLESKQQRQMDAVNQVLDELFAMRERREITSDEFMSRKARYAAEVASLTLAIETRAFLSASVVESVQERLRAAPEVLSKFVNGDVRDKRAVANLIATSYVLTLDAPRPNLGVSLDPVFDLIRSFEPKNHPDQQIGPDGFVHVNPIWRLFLTSIRTLIAKEIESRMDQFRLKNEE